MRCRKRMSANGIEIMAPTQDDLWLVAVQRHQGQLVRSLLDKTKKPKGKYTDGNGFYKTSGCTPQSCMSMDSLWQALHCFKNRRGRSPKIYHDDSLNFVVANQGLFCQIQGLNRAIWTMKRSGFDYDLTLRHRGKLWDALIKSVRRKMFSMTKQRRPEDETVKTLFNDRKRMLTHRTLVSAASIFIAYLAFKSNALPASRFGDYFMEPLNPRWTKLDG